MVPSKKGNRKGVCGCQGRSNSSCRTRPGRRNFFCSPRIRWKYVGRALCSLRPAPSTDLSSQRDRQWPLMKEFSSDTALPALAHCPFRAEDASPSYSGRSCLFSNPSLIGRPHMHGNGNARPWLLRARQLSCIQRINCAPTCSRCRKPLDSVLFNPVSKHHHQTRLSHLCFLGRYPLTRTTPVRGVMLTT